MSKKNTSVTEEKNETSRRKFIKKVVVAGVAGVAAVTSGKALEAVEKKLKPGTKSFVKIKAGERNALLTKLKQSLKNRELVLKGMGEKLGGYSDHIDYSDHINEWDAGMKTKIKTRQKMK